MGPLKLTSKEQQNVCEEKHIPLEIIKDICNKNDPEVVKQLRIVVCNGDSIIYTDSSLGRGIGTLYFYDFSVEQQKCMADIRSIIEYIGNNNGLMLGGQNHEKIEVHPRTGRVCKIAQNERIVYPCVEMSENIGDDITVGNIAVYTTSVDQHHHFGEVEKVEDKAV